VFVSWVYAFFPIWLYLCVLRDTCFLFCSIVITNTVVFLHLICTYVTVPNDVTSTRSLAHMPICLFRLHFHWWLWWLLWLLSKVVEYPWLRVYALSVSNVYVHLNSYTLWPPSPCTFMFASWYIYTHISTLMHVFSPWQEHLFPRVHIHLSPSISGYSYSNTYLYIFAYSCNIPYPLHPHEYVVAYVYSETVLHKNKKNKYQ